MRAFFALPLPEATRERLALVQDVLRRAAERRGLSLRWTRPEQQHVTLKFLGDVDPEAGGQLARRMAPDALRLPPIATEVSAPSTFGPPARARVLVLPVADQGGLILGLATALDRAAAELGVPPETRAFRPHLTLARFSRPGDASALLSEQVPLPAEVVFDRMVLYESELHPTGSRYRPVEELPLGANPG